MRTISITIVMLISPIALAHHSISPFDMSKTVTIEGTVARYEWANPHVYIHLTDLAADGGNWLVEAGSPSMVQRLGWSPATLAVGDAVVVEANPARNPERRMALGVSVRKGDGVALSLRGQPGVPIAAPPPVAAENLSGNWLPGPDPAFLPFVLPPTAWKLTPKAAEALARVDPENNPGNDCVALQAPFHMAWTDLKSIELTRDSVILRSAVNVGVERIVHLNVATHDGAPFSNEGHSIGRWENGVLAVDTRNFIDHPVGNRDGVPSGAQKHLVERFELAADRTTLTYRYWLEDPEYLAAPFEGSAVWAYRPDLTYTAQECDLENARRYLEER
jgi:hypothetical protein